MPFRNNPYGNVLQLISEQLKIPNARVNSSGLFEYASFDPKAAIEREQLRDRIPNSVCIIGAGVAGLTAAYELSRISSTYEKPSNISVLEKGSRIGGRIFTRSFNKHDGYYAELGAMRIPAYHKIVLH